MLEPGLAACFVAVAEDLSFTRAASKLGLTQPQVSLRIRKLEAQLGFPLFVRTTRQVELTPEAQSLLPYARGIVRACRAADEYLSALESTRTRLLRLGSPEVTLTSPARAKLLAGFIDRYSTIRLEISIGVTTDLLAKLQAMQIDAVLNFRFQAEGRSSPTPAWQHAIPLQRSVGYLAIPREHPLADLAAVRPCDLAGYEMALSPGTECPDVIDDIQAYLHRLSIRIRRAPETHRATLQHFARANRLPCFAWAVEGEPLDPGADGVVLRPFSDRQFVHELCLITRSADESLPTRSLRKLAREVTALATSREAA